MTNNQINYVRSREEKRHNAMVEELTARANEEVVRHNLQTEANQLKTAEINATANKEIAELNALNSHDIAKLQSDTNKRTTKMSTNSAQKVAKLNAKSAKTVAQTNASSAQKVANVNAQTQLTNAQIAAAASKYSALMSFNSAQYKAITDKWIANDSTQALAAANNAAASLQNAKSNYLTASANMQNAKTNRLKREDQKWFNQQDILIRQALKSIEEGKLRQATRQADAALKNAELKEKDLEWQKEKQKNQIAADYDIASMKAMSEIANFGAIMKSGGKGKAPAIK